MVHNENNKHSMEMKDSIKDIFGLIGFILSLSIGGGLAIFLFLYGCTFIPTCPYTLSYCIEWASVTSAYMAFILTLNSIFYISLTWKL
jgi:hypothetical protein